MAWSCDEWWSEPHIPNFDQDGQEVATGDSKAPWLLMVLVPGWCARLIVAFTGTKQNGRQPEVADDRCVTKKASIVWAFTRDFLFFDHGDQATLDFATLEAVHAFSNVFETNTADGWVQVAGSNPLHNFGNVVFGATH